MISVSDINFSIAAIGAFVFVSYLSFVAWMAIDAIRSGKLIWLIFILGLPLIGVTIYFFVEKEHDYMKIREK